MRTITVNCLVDVVAALADGTLSRNLFLTDDNAPRVASRRATDVLTTTAADGDLVIWVSQVLDVETEVVIEGIWGLPTDVCAPVPTVLDGTDVVYWWAIVHKDPPAALPYWLQFKVEGRSMRASLTSHLAPYQPTGY